jgi:ParB-like chromosome segregation protein Spo0J
MNKELENLIIKFLDKKSFDEKVVALNELRETISKHSPFNSEPVDFVRWVSINEISANDYNPNTVAPPEMELLRISIANDGYTQPIVANEEDGVKVVVDGFHRNRVGREVPEIKEKLHGYLPIVQIRAQQTDKADRMASTIRHNRARGKHQVIAMSDIVLDLKRRNWSDEKIAQELGMDPDEVLRLAQITGLAEAFKDREFSKSWEAIIEDEVEDLEESINA